MLLRAQAVALRARGRPLVEIADVVGCARSHVYRSIARFPDSGREGLLDGRRHNGSPLADQRFRETVASLLWQSPEDYAYPRPTWTRELLVRVILDNYGIHHSHETRLALMRLPRIRLHFLPPYCPDHNRIERLWQDLHANVTRNHRHTDFLELCHDVASYLDAVSPWLPGRRPVWTETRHQREVAAPHE